MSTISQPYAFTIIEFCSAYGVGRSFAYVEIAAGRLKARKAGKRTLIMQEDAKAWADALPQLRPNP